MGLTMHSAVTALQKNTYHHHQCANRECRRPFRDAKCADAHVDVDECWLCRGKSWPDMYRFLLPRPCCETDSQQVIVPEEIRAYKLAGKGPWFRCRTCSRVSGWPRPTPEETSAS